MNLKKLDRPLSENEIQLSILEFLRFKKIPGIRVNNHAVYDEKRTKFRKPHIFETWKGSPLDIMVFLPDGRSCWIEVKKNARLKASKNQEQFIENINSRGGIAFVAFSIDCIKENLSEYL